MDATKIFTILCAFLLIVCLMLSVTALLVMQSTVRENDALSERVEIMVGKFNTDATPPEADTDTDAGSLPDGTDPPATDVDVLYNRLCLRAVGNRICVYTEDGYLIRTLDVDLRTLSDADQAALEKGIFVNSWRELIERIQDYES